MANLTLTAPTFANSSDVNFGQVLSGGGASAGANYLTATTFTIECRITGAAGGIDVIIGQAGAFWLGVDSGTNIIARYGDDSVAEIPLNSAGSIAGANSYHVALVVGPSGGKLFLDGVLVASSATVATISLVRGDFTIRQGFANAASFNFAGTVDEVALFYSEKYTANFTPPTLPYVGNEANLDSLWHLDGNGTDSVGGGGADTTIPVITLLGNSTVTVTQGGTYTDAGATASDNIDGDITANITTVNPVNVNTVGAYTVTYNVDDAAGNSATQVTRTVNVVVASSTITNDNAAITYSPYTWNITSGESKSICGGAYFKTYITATTCTLNFDVTGLSAPLPRLYILIDGIEQTKAQVASTIVVNFPNNQDNDRHLLEVYFDASSETVNRWTTQANSIKFTGMDLSAGGTVSPVIARNNKMLVYGDSITEGVRTLNVNGATDVDRNSAIVNWPLELGRLTNSEVGVVGFGALGIINGGAGGVPRLADSWDFLYSGVARDFSNPPDLCCWLMGTNDGGANSVSAGLLAINGMLTAMPATKFILFRPFNGASQEANLQTIAATCNDPSRVSYKSTAGYWDSADASDSLHPYGYAALADIAPSMAVDTNEILNASYTGSNSNLTMTITSVPDGANNTRVINAVTGELILNQSVVWASGSATVSIPTATGSAVEYYVIGATDGGLQRGTTA